MIISKLIKGDTKIELRSGINGSGKTNFHVQTERKCLGKIVYWSEAFDNLQAAENWIKYAV